MRLMLCAALLAAGTAVANEDPFLKGSDLKGRVERMCQEGCLTFNRQEAEDFQDQLDKLITAKRKEAFQAGMHAQKQACASLVSR